MNEWKTVRLGDVCELIMGTSPEGNTISDNPSNGIEFHQGKTFFGKVFLNESKIYTSAPSRFANAGNVIMSVRAPVGDSNITQRRIAIGRGLCTFNLKDDFEKFYLFYFLNSKIEYLQSKSTGSTFKAVNKDAISDLQIPLPPLEEQKHIAAVLDKCTALIAKHKQMLEKYDTLIKSRFIEMFGDLANNTKNWIIKNFTDCAIIDTKMIKDFEKYAEYPHIGIDSIEKETGILSGYRTVKEDNVISGKYLFTPEHIIYSKIRPNLNKVAMPNFEGLCSADAYPILVKKNIATREYLTYVMRSDFFVSYILAFSRRANMPKVNKEQVESFNLPLPPFELQQQFSSFVQQIDKSKFEYTYTGVAA